MENIKKVFAYNLRKIRGERSQDLFSELIRVPKPTYVRWEAEKGKLPQEKNMRRLFEAMEKWKIPINTLFLDPDLAAPVSEKEALEAENRQLKVLADAQDQQLHKYAKLIELCDADPGLYEDLMAQLGGKAAKAKREKA